MGATPCRFESGLGHHIPFLMFPRVVSYTPKPLVIQGFFLCLRFSFFTRTFLKDIALPEERNGKCEIPASPGASAQIPAKWR